ncbi:hypothetical protein ES702_04097 [subsurface metagenome]
MRTEKEIREFKDELYKIVAFIADNGNEDEFMTKEQRFACDICDTLNWVLGEETTEHFKSIDFLDYDKLLETIKGIEKRTGLSWKGPCRRY